MLYIYMLYIYINIICPFRISVAISGYGTRVQDVLKVMVISFLTILVVWLVVLYGILTFIGYLMHNSVYIYIYIYIYISNRCPKTMGGDYSCIAYMRDFLQI